MFIIQPPTHFTKLSRETVLETASSRGEVWDKTVVRISLSLLWTLSTTRLFRLKTISGNIFWLKGPARSKLVRGMLSVRH